MRSHGCYFLSGEQTVLSCAHLLRHRLQSVLTPRQSRENIFELKRQALEGLSATV